MSGIANSITMIIDHIQQTSIIASVNIPWPPGVDVAISYLRAARLDLANKIGNIVYEVSFRTQYLLLVNLVPLLIAILLLAIFQPFYVVLYYFAILIGCMATISGIFNDI